MSDCSGINFILRILVFKKNKIQNESMNKMTELCLSVFKVTFGQNKNILFQIRKKKRGFCVCE